MQHKAALVLWALLCARGAQAQAEDVVRERAREHYARGLELAGQGQYESALAEFRAAYQERPHYAALYNIGQAYIELDRSVEAILALERYLAEGKDQISPERAQQVHQQIAVQKARTAELTVTVEAPGASISLDGIAVGGAPRVGPLRVSAGTHDVAWSVAGMPGMSRTVVLSAGQTLELAFSSAPASIALPSISAPRSPLALAPAAALPAPAPLADPADALADSSLDTLGYVLGGVGLVLGGVALGQYFWNRARYEQWQAEDAALGNEGAGGQDHRQRQLENNELAASIERASHWTVALSVAGGAFVASGATLLVVHASAPAPGGRDSATLFLLQGAW